MKRETGEILISIALIAGLAYRHGLPGLAFSSIVVGYYWSNHATPGPPASEVERTKEYLGDLEAPARKREAAPAVIPPAADDEAGEILLKIRL